MLNKLTNNKQGEKMKTITLTLTPEQEEILLARVDRNLGGLHTKDQTYLGKKYKNPNEDTKKRIFSAKKSWAKIVRENEIADGFIKQLQEQLNNKPDLYNKKVSDILNKEVTDENVEEIYKRGGLYVA